MTAAALKIGDQLILEEEYDENYIPSEQEIHEYAREIGIDPVKEPELLWLAREGIVAPLPPEWKPCQDVTGDVYYFNFSSGQSTWDHPCDEQYRQLVLQERERAQPRPSKTLTSGGKKEKKKKDKKEKKGKKKDQELKPAAVSMGGMPLTSGLGPLPAPLSSLAPLRGFGAETSIPPLRGSLLSSEGLKSSLGGPLSSLGSSLLEVKQQEQRSLTSPGLKEDEKASDRESPCGQSQLMHNLHLDLDALGKSFQYEDSEASVSAPPEELTEPELQDLGRDHSPEPGSQETAGSDHKLKALSPTDDVKRELNEKEDSRKSRRREKEDLREMGKFTERYLLGLDGDSFLEEQRLQLCASSPEASLSSSSHIKHSSELGEDRSSGLRKLGASPVPVPRRGLIRSSHASSDAEEHEEVNKTDMQKRGGTENNLMSSKVEKQKSEQEEEEEEEEKSKEQEEEEELEVEVEVEEEEFEELEEEEDEEERELEFKILEKKMPEERKGMEKLGEGKASSMEEDTMKEKSNFLKEKKVLKRREEVNSDVEETSIQLMEQTWPRVVERTKVIEDVTDGKLWSYQDEQRSVFLKEEARRIHEEEQRRLKEENEAKLRALRLELETSRREEEARLRADTAQQLQQLKESTQRDRELQQRLLIEENEAKLRELRKALEEERRAEHEQLEAQKRREIQRLREESELELMEEKRQLQKRAEEARASLKLEAKTDEMMREVPSSSKQQLAEYRTELGDVLLEIREELQRDHNRKVEQFKEEQRQKLETIRLEHVEQESSQREHLRTTLQEERERLLSSHNLQLEQLKTQLEKQVQRTRHTYSKKEEEIKDLELQLDIRTKDLKTQEAMLFNQMSDMQKRRHQLGLKENEIDGLHEDLERVTLERDRAREEAQQERQDKERLQGENHVLKAQREELEKKLELLQERCDQLNCRVSDLERTEKKVSSSKSGRKQTKVNAEGKETRKKDRESSSIPSDEQSLHVEDLEPPNAASTPPLPKTSESIEGLRYYISSEGMSLQRARNFLEQQSGNLSERQAVLMAARSSCFQGSVNQGVNQELLKNLQQEANHLEQLRATVQKGQNLLEKKAERLTHLESSLVEESSYNDTYRHDVDRKVTFVVSDSDMSSVDGHEGTDDHPTVPAKVQHLADSLQHISEQLNTVLEALSSLAQKKAPLLSNVQASYQPLPVPLSQEQAFSSGLLSGSKWSSGRMGTSNLGRAGHSFLFQKEPSGLPINGRGGYSVMGHYNLSGFPSPSEQVQSMLSTKSTEMDNQQLQSLIEGNKRWLETRRKDPGIPLFTRYRPPSSLGGLVQLGLDESNQIKVYHY